MELNQFHFAYPTVLCILLVIPLIWMLFLLFYRGHNPHHKLEKFIDSHLLPYLLVNTSLKKKSPWKGLFFWSLVWLFLTLALAGPRWSFREMETFSKDQSLIILLDLSESMNATDVKPSRLARAKQKIEDLINLSEGVKIGLIAFAADPHMITPVTEDKETIRHLLPSLETSLMHVQGSKLAPALNMASAMLDAQPGTNKALLVISDGGFEDASAIATAKKLADKGFIIHAMGIGTLEGAPLRDIQGVVIQKNGTPILSKLEKDRLSEISTRGKGRYLSGHYSNQDEMTILKELEKQAEAQLEKGKKNKLWDEHFYLFLLPLIPIMLWWFRRSTLLVSLLFFCTLSVSLEGTSFQEYFRNSEQQGEEAFNEENYEKAINTFQDPYRKGVSCYEARQYDQAEKCFRESCRPDVACNATYNLGNSLAQQEKYKDAIKAYENVLKQWPDHTKAKENLEIIKKKLQEQQQDQSQSNQSDQSENSDNSDNQENDKNSSNSEKNDEKNQNSDGDSQNDQEPPQQDQQDQQDQKSESQDEKQEESDPQNEESHPPEEKPEQPQEQNEVKPCKTQEDHDADFWLNRITNDPQAFLKNKFFIESQKNGTTEGIDPW